LRVDNKLLILQKEMDSLQMNRNNWVPLYTICLPHNKRRLWQTSDQNETKWSLFRL